MVGRFFGLLFVQMWAVRWMSLPSNHFRSEINLEKIERQASQKNLTVEHSKTVHIDFNRLFASFCW
jgi:uncharacterized membrane protein YciS (DUF1049 family)